MSFYVQVVSCFGSWFVENVTNLQVGIANTDKFSFNTPSRVEQHFSPHSSGTSCSCNY